MRHRDGSRSGCREKRGSCRPSAGLHQQRDQRTLPTTFKYTHHKTGTFVVVVWEVQRDIPFFPKIEILLFCSISRVIFFSTIFTSGGHVVSSSSTTGTFLATAEADPLDRFHVSLPAAGLATFGAGAIDRGATAATSSDTRYPAKTLRICGIEKRISCLTEPHQRTESSPRIVGRTCLAGEDWGFSFSLLYPGHPPRSAILPSFRPAQPLHTPQRHNERSASDSTLPFLP